MKLCVPEKVLLQHVVVLGKTGAGKSSALRHVVEHLLHEKKRVCIIDPKGDWWGLKSSADGRSAGFPVIAFGDFKETKASDVPINAHSGKHVAELITSGNRPCVIGFRGWMTAHMVRFWIDFSSTIFATNAGELYLVVDEFHNFAPKGKIMDPEAGKCLHWSNRLLSEGRGLGVVCLTASQRPQKVHNDSLTSHETLVAMRVIHAADRQAIKDWIDGCGDAAQGKEVLNTLANLARGEAWVWSPEIGYGPVRIRFPLFETFDSFAPPQLQKRVSNSGWADIDLGVVKEKLATVIEEAKANDPRELKMKIAELQKQLSAKPMAAPEVREVKIPDAEKLNDVLEGIGGVIERLDALPKFRDYLIEATGIITRELSERKPAPSVFTGRQKFVARMREHHASPAVNGESIGGGMRRMMIALAQRPNLNRRQLGLRAGMSSGSGTFATYLAKLRTNQWLEETHGGGFALSADGRKALGNYEPLPEGRELLDYWLRELGGGAERMLRVLADEYPKSLSRDELGTRADISPGSGTFATYLAKLRTLELVEGRGELRASEELFT